MHSLHTRLTAATISTNPLNATDSRDPSRLLNVWCFSAERHLEMKPNTSIVAQPQHRIYGSLCIFYVFVQGAVKVVLTPPPPPPPHHHLLSYTFHYTAALLLGVRSSSSSVSSGPGKTVLTLISSSFITSVGVWIISPSRADFFFLFPHVFLERGLGGIAGVVPACHPL